MRTRAATGPSAPSSPSTAVTVLGGIGPTTAARLAAAGIRTLLDLLLFFPRRCRPLRDLDAPAEAAVGELVRLRGRVHAVRSAWLPGRRSLLTIVFAGDDGSTFAASFFNQPWLKKHYAVGQPRVVEGVLQLQGRRFVLQQAKVLPRDAAPAGEVQLRYAEVDGIGAARLQQWLRRALAVVDWDRLALPPLPPALADLDAPPA